MEPKEVLKFFVEKGLLVDKEVLDFFSEITDEESTKLIIEKLKNHTQQKIITKEIFLKNKEKVSELFLNLPKENQQNLEKLKIKLGLSIEISKEVLVSSEKEKEFSQLKTIGNVEVKNSNAFLNKKIEISDFNKYFRNRYNELKNILQEHSELKNLVSINKISGNISSVSVIGMISDKRITKNSNLIFEIEDFTGTTKVIVNQNKKEVYEKALDICLDSVIGFKCSGSNKVLFANDVVFPESILFERKKSPVEESVAFIGDLHFGSNLFFEKSFLKFIDYLNGNLQNSDESKKIKYLFIVGDLVAGIGNYPDQEKNLKIKNLEEQFIQVANLLDKIRKDITIIISTGNHDCVRLMEPQPVFDKKFAWPLYNLENVIITENPCIVNVGKKYGFSGFNILTYHGFSFPYYSDNVSSLIQEKAINFPDKIMAYLLKNRHLSPTHSTMTQHCPLEKDALLIRRIPDIFVAGHLHKSAISYYNNILLVSSSCWEAMTSYQEKRGNKPDFCKVPLFNLKTRKIKILDFEEK